MLNEKLVQNLTANIEASLAAALAIANAQSLPEALKLHTEFFQKLAAQTPEQTKEFFDLSTRRVWVSLRRMLSTRTYGITGTVEIALCSEPSINLSQMAK